MILFSYAHVLTLDLLVKSQAFLPFKWIMFVHFLIIITSDCFCYKHTQNVKTIFFL